MKPIFIFIFIYLIFLFPVLTLIHPSTPLPPSPPPKKNLLNLYPSNIYPTHPNTTILTKLKEYIIEDN